VEALKAQVRERESGNYVRELRRKGWVPAVVYGTEVNNLAIQIEGRALDAALRTQATNKPFRLVVDGQEHDVMVYELQRHPLAGNILHADFKAINMNEKIHTTVPILLTGDPELGVATLVRHSVEVSCLPGNIPESFTVNVDGLNIGDVLLVQDLQIPAGVDVGLDSMEVLISILPVKAASEESLEAAEDAAETAEAAGSTEDSKKV